MTFYLGNDQQYSINNVMSDYRGMHDLTLCIGIYGARDDLYQKIASFSEYFKHTLYIVLD